MSRPKKIWWKKHPKCEFCKNGFKYEYYDCLCGGNGVRKIYCHSCRELWEKDFVKIKSRGNIDEFGMYKKSIKIPVPEKVARYVISNKRKLVKQKNKK